MIVKPQVSLPEPPIKRRPRKTFDWSTAFIALAAVISAAIVYWRDGQARFLEILLADVFLFLDIVPKVLAACLIASFVALLMPRDVVVKWVGAESGFLGLVIATLAGIIVPGGPITVYPVAAAFMAVGAGTGATIAFVTSWTLLGYNRALVWELPFFGADFVIWRSIVALPLPIVAGLLAQGLARWFRVRIGGG